MSDCGRGLGDICGRVATRRAKATSLQVDQSTGVTHTSQQVRRRVRPVVGPDQLPVEVVVLTLPVVAEAGLGVLVKSAASCSENKKERKKGHEKEKRRRKRTTGIPEETFGKYRVSSFENNPGAARANVPFVIRPIKYLLKKRKPDTCWIGRFHFPSETSPPLPWPPMREVPQVVPDRRSDSDVRLGQLTEASCGAFVFIKRCIVFFALRKKKGPKTQKGHEKEKHLKISHNRFR